MIIITIDKYDFVISPSLSAQLYFGYSTVQYSTGSSVNSVFSGLYDHCHWEVLSLMCPLEQEFSNLFEVMIVTQNYLFDWFEGGTAFRTLVASVPSITSHISTATGSMRSCVIVCGQFHHPCFLVCVFLAVSTEQLFLFHPYILHAL